MRIFLWFWLTSEVKQSGNDQHISDDDRNTHNEYNSGLCQRIQADFHVGAIDEDEHGAQRHDPTTAGPLSHLLQQISSGVRIPATTTAVFPDIDGHH